MADSIRTKNAFEGYLKGLIQIEPLGKQWPQPLFQEQFWILINGPKDLL